MLPKLSHLRDVCTSADVPRKREKGPQRSTNGKVNREVTYVSQVRHILLDADGTTRSAAMQQSEVIPQQYGPANPNCPDCGSRMFLAEIEPHKPDYDSRIFACPQCRIELVEIVKYK